MEYEITVPNVNEAVNKLSFLQQLTPGVSNNRFYAELIAVNRYLNTHQGVLTKDELDMLRRTTNIFQSGADKVAYKYTSELVYDRPASNNPPAATGNSDASDA